MFYNYDAIFPSLSGFYKPRYDVLTPKEIYNLYIKEKKRLVLRKKEEYLKKYHQEYLTFAIRHKNLVIGFFKDKQEKRKKIYDK